MNSLRRSAARLAALGKRDRAWIWRRLDSREQKVIKPILDELLGLSLDALSVELRLASREPPGHPESVRRSDESDLSLLRRASPKEVAPLVSELPLSSVALVMCLEKWWWIDEVLKNFHADEQQMVKAVIDRSDFAPNRVLGDWLLNQLANRLRAERARLAPAAKKFDVLVDLAT